LAFEPARPQAQPGEVAPRPLHYPTDVQPIWDRYCVSCHNPQKPESKLDLSGTMTDLFCRSYEQIIHQDLVGYIQEFVRSQAGRRGRDGLRAGGAAVHVRLTPEQADQGPARRALRRQVVRARKFIRLATWVDANAPYYGSYFGRRNIAHRDRPDFRPVPTLESALGLTLPGHSNR